jgi:hypothetical protein
MQRAIVFSLFALLALGAAHDACAQHRGGAGHGFSRGGHRLNRARYVSPYGFGYGYPSYDFDAGYSDAPQTVLLMQQPPPLAQPPAPPAVVRPGNPVVIEYKWPAADMTSPAPSGSEPQPFAIVLKDGLTLSALMVFASDDGLHYVDLDERHLRISVSEVDRAATLKLNRARNLNLYLPAAQ